MAIVAFIIEVIGVATEMPFGSYVYGENLGPKLLGVPLIIGVNWVMLLYCCNVIFIKQPVYIAALYSALLMILLDYIMEQNVEKLGFWFWKDSIIPFQNYLSWFLISFVFSLIIKRCIVLKPNKPAIALYIIQIVFFTYCYFII
jgi:putative membrane protein